MEVALIGLGGSCAASEMRVALGAGLLKGRPGAPTTSGLCV